MVTTEHIEYRTTQNLNVPFLFTGLAHGLSDGLITPMHRAAHRGGGGQLGHFAPGPSLKGAPGCPMKAPMNTCLKDRYTLIEQSDLNTLIEQSQYSSEEQCSKLIDKEIWLVMGSYCHCQQVVTFFFFFFFGLHLTTWVKGPTLTLCPGPLNFSGRPCPCIAS